MFIVLHGFALRGTDFEVAALVTGAEGMASFLADAFPPDLAWEGVLAPALKATTVTRWIGLLGTTLSIPSALLLAVFASRTTTPRTGPCTSSPARSCPSSALSPTSCSR